MQNSMVMSRPDIENKGSIQYLPKKGTFSEKGHQQFHHPLCNPFFSAYTQIKLCMILTKGTASDCWMHKMSRLGLGC